MQQQESLPDTRQHRLWHGLRIAALVVPTHCSIHCVSVCVCISIAAAVIACTAVRVSRHARLLSTGAPINICNAVQHGCAKQYHRSQVTDQMAESGDSSTVTHDDAAEAPAIDTEVIP